MQSKRRRRDGMYVIAYAQVRPLFSVAGSSEHEGSSSDDEKLLRDSMTREQIAEAWKSLKAPCDGDKTERVIREFKDHCFRLVKKGNVVEYQCTCVGCH